VIAEIERLVDNETAGDPMSDWRWTHKTTVKIAGQLQRLGIQVGARTVARLLRKLRFSLRSNRKNISSGSRSGRDQQFGRIARLRKLFCRQGDPILSVDAKKRELVGNFKNAGVKWERVSTQVNDHDFRSLSSGIALPYGIYDLQANRGSVFVGVSHETSAFAVHSICRWWNGEGRQRYPHSRRLLILADTGGSNSATRGAWKDQIQQHLCDELGLTVTVAHYPAGASKYNPIERRLFSQITRNWAAEPLTCYDKTLQFIRKTTTTTGLKVRAYLDRKDYPLKVKPTAERLRQLKITRPKLLPKWNYTIAPLNVK
jgi:Rhodopirellula transposase DDE domain